LVAAIALVRDTLENGHDFQVFWQGARAVLGGESLYSDHGSSSGMVFKYPPWILPVFLPFGLLPLWTAKLVWGLVEVASLGFIVQWVRIYGGCKSAAWLGVFVAYWGLWAVHALDGQIALLLLAIALWAWIPQVFEKSWTRSAILFFTLSAKIFTVFPLFQVRLNLRLFRGLLGIVSLLLFLSVPALLGENSDKMVTLFHHWSEAATSGGSRLTTEQIRGRYNPSLTSLILRILHVPSQAAWADVGVALLLALLVGSVWKKVSGNLSPLEAWVGWLALTPVIHPLPWWHLFVFSFPLAVISLDRAWTRSNSEYLNPAFGCALCGIFLIGLATEKLLGTPGLLLEIACAKSWGVLLCSISLVLSSSRLSTSAAT
jgi:alpha-1,2-mannosyltransferase